MLFPYRSYLLESAPLPSRTVFGRPFQDLAYQRLSAIVDSVYSRTNSVFPFD